MLVNFVLMLTVLMGCCGLALDIGMLELKTVQLQNAADAAALGGMLELERGNSSWKAAGQAEAAQNGFTNGSANTTVAMTNPPSGFYATDYSAVQAVTSQKQLPIFMSVLNVGALTPNAQAVAQAPPCAYFMGNVPGTYSLNTASNRLSGPCPLYVRRTFNNDGFAQTHMSAIRISGSTSDSLQLGGTYTPTPYFNLPVLGDPLAWVASPAYSSCTYMNTAIMMPMTLSPGTYCGMGVSAGLTIMNTSVTLQPGLYIITNGLMWNAATVTGTGVTLFLTSQNPTSGYGKFNIRGNSVVNLSAPTDSSGGGVPGVVVFADRNWVQTSAADFSLDTSTFTGDGIWYLVNTSMYIGQAQLLPNNYLGVVMQSLNAYNSTIHLASNYSSLPGGNPFHPRGTLVQ